MHADRDVQRFADALRGHDEGAAVVPMAERSKNFLAVLNRTIDAGIRGEAKAFTLIPGEDGIEVAFHTKDGGTFLGEQLPGNFMGALVTRLKIMAGTDIVEKGIAQSGMATYTYRDGEAKRDFFLNIIAYPLQLRGDSIEAVTVHISEQNGRDMKAFLGM